MLNHFMADLSAFCWNPVYPTPLGNLCWLAKAAGAPPKPRRTGRRHPRNPTPWERFGQGAGSSERLAFIRRRPSRHLSMLFLIDFTAGHARVCHRSLHAVVISIAFTCRISQRFPTLSTLHYALAARILICRAASGNLDRRYNVR